MNVELIHWSLLRVGDLFVNGDGAVVAVAAVTFTGLVWDVNGDAWASQDAAGRVSLARPVTQMAKDIAAMERYAAATRNIIIEVCG